MSAPGPSTAERAEGTDAAAPARTPDALVDAASEPPNDEPEGSARTGGQGQPELSAMCTYRPESFFASCWY